MCKMHVKEEPEDGRDRRETGRKEGTKESKGRDEGAGQGIDAMCIMRRTWHFLNKRGHFSNEIYLNMEKA